MRPFSSLFPFFFTGVCLLLSLPVPTSAALSPPSHLIRRAHKSIVKRGAPLVNDMRVALGGLGQRAEVPRRSCNPRNGTSGSLSDPGQGATSTSGTPRASGSASVNGTDGSNGTESRSDWKLVESHQGSDFFHGWDFFTDSDPTHGVVQYLGQSDAQSSNLTYTTPTNSTIISVSTVQTINATANRPSVRITAQSQLNFGLVLLDAAHMPAGCGTWPSFWATGPNWPTNGEIDIIEGVNDYTNNQATLHTAPGCTLPSGASPTSLAIAGTLVTNDNCDAVATANAGCGIRSTNSTTYGSGFNSIGGGVYAMKWDNSSISVYFFPRSFIPSDITAGSPNPSSGWGQPMANWPGSSCNPTTFFKNISLVFDTTLCGDWAGSVWSAAGVPGQEQSCAQRTGYATCEDFVRNRGDAFTEAYWEINSVKVYKQS